MNRIRPTITALILAIVVLTFVGPAAAAPGKPPKARPVKATITWSTPRVEQSLAPGASATVEVTLTSSVDMAEVTFRVPGGLGRVLRVDAGGVTSLQAGVATPMKLIITMPATGAHSQGGVVQVRSGQRAIPTPLSVKINLPASDDDAD